jgi:hypothetical protein
MIRASKYWADKLPQDKKAEFWTLVGLGFSGETAFARVEQRLGLVEHRLADDLSVSGAREPR